MFKIVFQIIFEVVRRQHTGGSTGGTPSPPDPDSPSPVEFVPTPPGRAAKASHPHPYRRPQYQPPAPKTGIRGLTRRSLPLASSSTAPPPPPPDDFGGSSSGRSASSSLPTRVSHVAKMPSCPPPPPPPMANSNRSLAPGFSPLCAPRGAHPKLPPPPPPQPPTNLSTKKCSRAKNLGIKNRAADESEEESDPRYDGSLVDCSPRAGTPNVDRRDEGRALARTDRFRGVHNPQHNVDMNPALRNFRGGAALESSGESARNRNARIAGHGNGYGRKNFSTNPHLDRLCASPAAQRRLAQALGRNLDTDMEAAGVSASASRDKNPRREGSGNGRISSKKQRLQSNLHVYEDREERVQPDRTRRRDSDERRRKESDEGRIFDRGGRRYNPDEVEKVKSVSAARENVARFNRKHGLAPPTELRFAQPKSHAAYPGETRESHRESGHEVSQSVDQHEESLDRIIDIVATESSDTARREMSHQADLSAGKSSTGVSAEVRERSERNRLKHLREMEQISQEKKAKAYHEVVMLQHVQKVDWEQVKMSVLKREKKHLDPHLQRIEVYNLLLQIVDTPTVSSDLIAQLAVQLPVDVLNTLPKKSVSRQSANITQIVPQSLNNPPKKIVEPFVRGDDDFCGRNDVSSSWKPREGGHAEREGPSGSDTWQGQ